MATRLKDTDVVVVGLGAAGGVAVLPLTQAGIDVVGLEAGTWLTKRDFAPDELRNNVRDWPMAVQKAQQEVPTHRINANANTTRAGSHPMMNAVGGTTLHYWAQSWRLNPWDFKVVSETTRKYGASRVPRGSTVEDWPFGLEELEPYYDKIEYEMGVSGQAGNIKGTIDPKGNIFEGPRNRAYPMPPLRSTGFIDLMTSAARGLGWSPFPGPASINSRSYQGRSACMYHGFCNKGGCHVDAKNGPHLTTIPRAQETGRLKVVTRAHVTSIDSDASGRVTGVTYVTDGQEFFQPAKVVLLSSYTYENSRLLLLSKSKAYPERPVEQSRPGRPPLHEPRARRLGHGAVSVQHQRLVRPAGAGRRGRQFRRRQFRSRRARLHRRRQPVGDVGSPPDRGGRHGHVRPHAVVGRQSGRSS